MRKRRLIHVLLALVFIAPLGLSACQSGEHSGGDEHAGDEASGDEHAGEDAE